LKRLLKKLGVQAAWDACCVACGLLVFRRTGRTPRLAQSGLVSLFCQTGGASNDFLHRRVARPPIPLVDARGVLGDMRGATLERVTRDLDERGFHVFERRLSDEQCDRLLRFALTEPAVVRNKRAVYDRTTPLGTRYEFDEPTLLRNETVQELMTDPSILAVAQGYLRCAPILDFVAMWWHTAYGGSPDPDAGQLFHFDMDRIKWLKFFIYVTDVGPENGPHTFVAGSHRTGGIPRSLLARGQTRIADEDVLRAYHPEDLVQFCAPRGTVIAEDTRGLHKGQHVESGDRLVFQLEMADSLFGVQYPVPEGFAVTARLREMSRAYSTVYSRFVR
jgi:hypothetical protein